MDNGSSDGLLWCKAQFGIDGCVMWQRGGRDTALTLFYAFLCTAVRVPGMRISGTPRVQYGTRSWLSTGPRSGRWILSPTGEVNERNAGNPPTSLDFQGRILNPPGGPPVIIKAMCGRYPSIITARDFWQGKSIPLTRSFFLHFDINPEFRAEEIVYTTGYITSSGANVGGLSGVIPFPYQGPTYVKVDAFNLRDPYRIIDPLDDGTLPVLVPGLKPVVGHSQLIASEDYLIFGSDTNFKPGPNRIGTRESYITYSSVLPGWFDTGGVLPGITIPPGQTDGYSYITVRFNYTSVPTGYAKGLGYVTTIPLVSCVFKPPKPPPPPQTCKEGFSTDGGNCLIYTTCDSNGVASDFEICGGTGGVGLEKLAAIIRMRGDNGSPIEVNFTMENGHNTITTTDDNGVETVVADDQKGGFQ